LARRSKYDGTSIEIVTGLEPVRLRPTMYVGDLEAPDLPVRLLRQAFCHAVDCALDGRCTWLRVTTSGKRAEVAYDAGMSLEPHPRLGDVVALLFLTLHAGCRNLKKHIEVGDDLCDIGLAVLTALSADLRLTTVHAGKTASFHFALGKEVSRSEIVPSAEPDRTTMTVELDPLVLGSNVVFESDAVRAAADHVQTKLPALRVEVVAS